MMTAQKLPEPPYYAVIFVNQRSKEDAEGYGITAERMVELAQKEEGYLGIESVRDDSGKGITVSYWQSLDSIQQWKNNVEHIQARKQGKDKWYNDYQLQIAKVEHGYRWIKNER
ncbi:MAG: antibiotic biosynthesis monooxygenase [Methylocystaceae bacterium]|nr:antibiotic biosynthesis monooxygenase [Methylocystaceae bacterium]